MKEELLHFVWKTKRFEMSNLQTTQQEKIQIVKAGIHNQNAGPDFSDAQIRIADTLWAGHVEMHLKSSDWLFHNHQEEDAYDNVILHVVLMDDLAIKRKDGSLIPCLELANRIPKKLARNYQKLQNKAYWIPCEKHILEVSQLNVNLWLDRLLIERLENKTIKIKESLLQNQNDWDLTFYQFLFRNLGYHVNSFAFENLALNTPLNIILKHKDKLFQIEALLFGQAGMLNKDFNDSYPRALQKEYLFLKQKYNLRSVSNVQWKFLRMRPANFPTIRIAQIAAILFNEEHLFRKVVENPTYQNLESIFRHNVSDYWKEHYVFDKLSKFQEKKLGSTALHLLMINTVAPFLFLYGIHQRSEKLKKNALLLLESIPPEQNHLIRNWIEIGQSPESAFETQALIELKTRYCDSHKCLSCRIGAEILSSIKN